MQMSDLSKKITELLSNECKAAPDMTHGLKNIGDGDMKAIGLANAAAYLGVFLVNSLNIASVITLPFFRESILAFNFPERIHLLTVSSDVFIILATSFTVYVSKESHLLKSSIHFNATFFNFYSIKI